MQFEKLVKTILSEGFRGWDADERDEEEAWNNRERDFKNQERNAGLKGNRNFEDNKFDTPVVARLDTVQGANGEDITNRSYVKFANEEENREHKINSEKGTPVDMVMRGFKGKDGKVREATVKIWSSADKFGKSSNPRFKSGAWITVPANKMVVVSSF